MTEPRQSDPAPDLLPTVVLEHAKTGQPIIVDLKDYLAGRDARYANWRLLAHGDVIPPPALKIDTYPELGSPKKTPSEQTPPGQAPPGQVSGNGGLARTLARPNAARSTSPEADGMTEPSKPRKPRRRGGKYGRQA